MVTAWGYPTKFPLSRSPYKHYVVLYVADPLHSGMVQS